MEGLVKRRVTSGVEVIAIDSQVSIGFYINENVKSMLDRH